MKRFYTLFLLTICFYTYSQHTVTTILDSPTINIDDALALDSKGNLYGSNFGYSIGTTVYKITPSGEVSEFITGLQRPNGLAFDSQDNLFAVNYLGLSIHKYDSNGNPLRTYNIGRRPSGLIKDFRSDAMIFTNVSDNSINKLDQDGTITTLYKGEPLNSPVGLTFDKNGTLFIGNFNDRKIYSLDKRGNLGYIATIPNSNASFPFLAFIAYANGRLYATVYSENKIFEVHPNKIDDVKVYSGTGKFGNKDGDISEAEYAFPSGIVANRSGNELYISEFSGLGNVRKITKGKKQSRKEKNFSVTAFPNPSSNYITISTSTNINDKLQLRLYNLNGIMVYESNGISRNNNYSKKINTKNFKRGLYTLIVTKNGEKKSKTLIIK